MGELRERHLIAIRGHVIERNRKYLGARSDIGLELRTIAADPSIDAILVWDSSMLRLAGRTDTGPYPWLSSSFPNDCALDGLNAPCSGLPANDGDALYRAFRNFSAPAIATPTGLLVTSFQFTALAMTPSTTVSIPAMRGNFTRSYVVDGYVAGLEITGTLGSATVTVVPEPAGLVILGCLVFAMMRRRMR